MLEAWLVAGAMWAGTARAGAVRAVVTFDNGEFNVPLYTPRWNGRWKQPSVAQEVATAIARVLGENPAVYTYLPPGRAPARPGEAVRIRPSRPGCTGPSDVPEAPCWCSTADNCWGALEPSWYAEASTSLFLTASTIRRALRADGPGPRVEIHVTDLFEEDPTAAEDPADSDRCVTRAGVRRAVSALLAPGEGERLDHLAVGVLRATVEPPPPGTDWGFAYALGPDGGGDCHAGIKARAWDGASAPISVAMAVLVLGYDTAGQHPAVNALLDGLVGQLDTGPLAYRQVRLREPPQLTEWSRVVRSSDTDPLVLPPPASVPQVPCAAVRGEGTLTSAGRPVAIAEVQGGCDGSFAVRFGPDALTRVFLEQAGLDPRRSSVTLDGGLSLEGDAEAIRAAWDRLAELNAGDRPMPLWGALDEALALREPPGPTRPWRPWTTRVEIRGLEVTDLDRRPWALAAGIGALAALVAGLLAAALGRRLHATRALGKRWEASRGSDPLIQRPLAVVIAEAQEEVDRGWLLRGAAASAVAGGVLLGVAWLVLTLHRVWLG